MSATIMTPAHPTQIEATRRFLDCLGGTDQAFVFQWFGDSTSCSVPPGHAYDTLESIDARLMNLNESGCGIFVTVNESAGGRKKEDITRVRALFVDLDGSPLQPVRDADIKPHIIVESSPGRWHAYWLVAADFPLDRFRDAQRALADRFGGDPAVNDLPRVMRLPGFTNRKQNPFVTRIEHVADDLTPLAADAALQWACPAATSNNVVKLPAIRQSKTPSIAPTNHRIRYSAHLLEQETKAVLRAPVGERNNQLNRAAFKLGPYVGAGLLSQGAVETKLKEGAVEAGLGSQEASATIRSGLRAGAQTPLDLNELDRQALALDVIDEMNAKHAAVMVGGQFAVLNLADDYSRFTYSKRADFFSRYADEAVPQLMQSGQAKPPTKAHIWWESALRRKYNGITFAPGKPQDVDGKFNTWRGFAITPKKGDSALYWQFVRDAICGGDEVVFAYVRRYLAHLVQKPNELPGIALVLRSGQGTGKNTFMKPISKIFGPAHYIEITSTEHLVGRFNSHLASKVVVFANEAFWPGDKDAEGRLKAMITDRNEAIEQKHFDLVQQDNYKRVIFASNADWVVPMDVDDRRFVMLEVSDKYKGDLRFWTRLNEELESGGHEAILYDLLNEPIDGFAITERPQTLATQRAALEQKMQRWDPATEFWYEALQSGHIPKFPTFRHDDYASLKSQNLWPTTLARPALYDAHCEWCRDNHKLHPAKDAAFAKKLRKLCPGIQDSRPTDAIGRRERHYVLPSLRECRKAFEEAVGAPIEWDTEEAAALSGECEMTGACATVS